MQTDVRESMLLLYVQIIKVLVTDLENKWVKFLSKSKSTLKNTMTFKMSKSRDHTWILKWSSEKTGLWKWLILKIHQGL